MKTSAVLAPFAAMAPALAPVAVAQADDTPTPPPGDSMHQGGDSMHQGDAAGDAMHKPDAMTMPHSWNTQRR